MGPKRTDTTSQEHLRNVRDLRKKLAVNTTEGVLMREDLIIKNNGLQSVATEFQEIFGVGSDEKVEAIVEGMGILASLCQTQKAVDSNTAQGIVILSELKQEEELYKSSQTAFQPGSEQPVQLMEIRLSDSTSVSKSNLPPPFNKRLSTSSTSSQGGIFAVKPPQSPDEPAKESTSNLELK